MKTKNPTQKKDYWTAELVIFFLSSMFALFCATQSPAQTPELRDPATGKPFRNFDPKTFALFEVDLTPQMLDTTELESAVHPVTMKFIGANWRYEWKSELLILVYDQNHILKGISFPSNVLVDNLTAIATNIETGEVKQWSVMAYKVRCRHNLCSNE